MMTELMLDTCKYAQCLCWLRPDNVIPCVVTSMWPFGKTQKRKIASHKYSAARLQSNSDIGKIPRAATSFHHLNA